ncbi:MAG: protein kinase [Synechococcales cyanobacterium C42_A2020_086]|jgi:serine/threonine-protein kinase|nr:protein kinase [Synechococcales cyanobacterium M58_A2018_015]MBF2075938.1 protein kinase [Synechococcales cyanobacterium C42_A2020_086]
MDIYCTRPTCPDPINSFPTLDQTITFRAMQQRYCTACTMPLILDGRYLPLKRLGKGAFGTTFLALDLRSAKRRQCVVKQLQPTSDLTPAQLEGVKRAFRREAETLETLGDDHHQIPSLYAYFELTTPVFTGSRGTGPLHTPMHETEEFFYLVQERIDGQDLDKELRQRGCFTEAEALDVLRQILPVLQFIHEHGAIHRDIKPSNIMRDSNNRLHLIDFGAVKQVTTGMPMQNSIVFGTLGFAPPEQVAGKQVFPSTDLYSLAVTIVCLLTSCNPQDMLNPHTHHLDWRPWVQVSDPLGAALDRMLQITPSQRFQAATDVMRFLFPEMLPHSDHPAAEVQPPVPSSIETAIPDEPESVALQQEPPLDLEETMIPTEPDQPRHSTAPPTTPSPPTSMHQPRSLSSPVSPSSPSVQPSKPLSPAFVARCETELTYYIGPIAKLIVEDAVAQHPHASPQQLIEALAQEIPDARDAQAFRQRFSAG